MPAGMTRHLVPLCVLAASVSIAAVAHAAGAIVTDFELGGSHACVANDCDVTYCWGGEEFVYGGDKGVLAASSPKIPADVATGDRHACVLWMDDPAQGGIVDCWGGQNEHQLDVPEGKWKQIDAGADHTCGLHPDNRVECWGDDHKGVSSGVPGGVSFRQVSTSATMTCAVTSGRHAVRCWGQAAGGITNLSSYDLPNGHSAIEEVFVKVSAGSAHACALSSYGRVYCWGDNAAQQVTPLNGGIPYAIEIPVEGGHEIYEHAGPYEYLDVSAGLLGTCAVRLDYASGDTEVPCWGYPFSFGFALWGKDRDALYVPTGGAAVERVELTYNQVCTLDETAGELACWDVLWDEAWLDVPANIDQCI